MAMFHYRAADAGGHVVTGTFEAKDERQVVVHLQQSGFIPLRIRLEEAAGRWQDRLPLGRGRISSRDVVHFTEELAVLLKAGLPLDRSLMALAEVTTRPALKAVLAQVLRDLQEGKSLGEALGRAQVFPPLYISLVEAGETGGFLEEALERLGDYLKTVDEFKSYLITTLIYPMILAGVGALSLILMLVYVVPRFETFFQEMGQNLYWSTRLLIGLSQALRGYWWLGALALVAACLSLRRLIRSSEGRLFIDRVKMTAPFLGDLSRRVAAVFFAKTLGTLLANGVPMVTSLRVVINTVNNRFLAKSLTGVLANVEKGQPLSGLLKKVGMFPELFLQMTAIGEETGHLADMLLAAATSLENDARAAVRRLLALLEPVLILVTSLVVAFIIVSLLLPILNLYEVQF
jgi:type II secretory pathway component PulF